MNTVLLIISVLLIWLETASSMRIGQEMVAIKGNGKPPEEKWMGGSVKKNVVIGRTGGKIRVKRSTGAVPQASKTIEAQSKTQKQFLLEVLDEINKKRRNHGVKPLILNEKLQKLAQQIARTLAKKKDVNTKISIRKDIGHNIFYMSSNVPNFEITGKDAVDRWYKGVEEHDFSKEPGTDQTLKSGNFAQMVWKDSTSAGIGFARSADKKFADVVALFEPRGNWVGEFTDQVLESGNKNKEPEEPAREEDFNEASLKAHNEYRKMHHVEPLKLSNELNRVAQAYADHLAKIDVMQHSNNKKYGENLSTNWSSVPKITKGKESVDAWYSEIKDYNFRKPKFHSNTGHFTQIIWKATKELGVGVAQNKKSKNTYVVANYSPPGNYIGQFESNVLPL